mgnify:FL=1
MKASSSRLTDCSVIALVLAIAGAARLVGLDDVPPGLHFDEAFNALDALQVRQGNLALFFEGNFGREPLFIYLLAAAFQMFEPGPAVIRGAAAAAGTLAVPLTYGIGRLLFPQSCWPGLLAALVQAVLPWDLHFSRYGLRVELLPLLGSAAFLCLLLGWRRRRRAWFVLGGAFLGLSLYGYMAARLLPLVALLWGVGALALARPPERKSLAAHLALAALCAAIVFAPLGAYFLQHPASFGHRAGQVLLKGESAGFVEGALENTGLWARAFLLEGDANPRNNLPGAPALTPWLALPFLLGILPLARRRPRPETVFLLGWLGVMLLPSILTDYAPSFQRAIGAVPPLCLLVGSGLHRLAAWVTRRTGRTWVGSALAVVLLLGNAGQSLHQYFVRWGQDNALYYAFDEGIYAIGEYMRAVTRAGQAVYLTPVRPDHATLHYLLRDVDGPRTFDGRQTFVLPPGAAGPVHYVILTQEDDRSTDTVSLFHPDAVVERAFLDRDGNPYAVAMMGREPALASHRLRSVEPARWAEGMTLVGLRITEEKEPHGLRLDALWSSDTEIGQDYTAFFHLIGPPNPESGAALWAQSDAMPGGGTYVTTQWRVGEIVVDRHWLAVPEDIPDGEFQLIAGWYLLATHERVPLLHPQPGQDHLVLGSFSAIDGDLDR